MFRFKNVDKEVCSTLGNKTSDNIERKEGYIDDERQFKTVKRSQEPGDATVLKRFFPR